MGWMLGWLEWEPHAQPNIVLILPLGYVEEAPPVPSNGMCCAWGPVWLNFGTDDGPSQGCITRSISRLWD